MTHPQRVVALFATLALLAGCTGEPPLLTSAAEVNAPTLPTETFPGLPDRGSGVRASVDALVSDGTTLVSVQTVYGVSSVPLLRYSTDAGATWSDGQLSTAAAETTEVDETTVDVAAVATRGDGRLWLAIGAKRDSLFAWTSTDARTWDRTPIKGIKPAKGDQVNAVTGLEDGTFVAVGGRRDGEKSRPKVWTSPDGITWTAQEIPGYGWLHNVAASGKRVVAVGSRGLTEVKNGRSQYSLLFTSTNRGKTWRSVPVAEPPSSGHFYSYLTQAVATESGFVVGGSFYDGVNGTYRPFLLSTSNVKKWNAVRSLPSTGQATHLAELTRVGSATVALESVETSGAKDRLKAFFLFDGDRQWTAAANPGSSQNLASTSSAAIGDTAVFGVEVDGNPPHERFWRFTSPGRVNQVEVDAPADSRTNVQPNSLLVVDGQLTAFGDAQGAPVLWSGDGTSFSAPSAVTAASNETIDDVVWSAKGGYLAIGDVDGSYGFVRTSRDGKTWQRVKPSTYNKVAQYRWSTINDATWAHGRWVVVGAKTSNGNVRESGLVYTSSNGKSWTEGKPTTVTARGDWYGSRSPLDDLHGLDNRSRQLIGVVGVDKGLIAVGRTTKGLQYRPAAWLSTDNRNWRLVPLTSGKYPDSNPATVHSVGGVLVADGWASAEGSSYNVRARWRSTDGGRSWKFTATTAKAASWLTTSSDTEFLQIVTAEDERSVTLFRSTDGATWSESPITIDGLAEGMEIGVRYAIVHDGAPHVLLTLSNRLDAVTVVQRVEL